MASNAAFRVSVFLCTHVLSAPIHLIKRSGLRLWVALCLLPKIAGWNMLRATASEKVRAWVATQVAKTLGMGDAAQAGLLCNAILALIDRHDTVSHRTNRQTIEISVATAV